MRIFKNRKKGQTALEYALVLGVICVGVIFAGKVIFGDKEGGAAKLMNRAVDTAAGQIGDDGEP